MMKCELEKLSPSSCLRLGMMYGMAGAVLDELSGLEAEAMTPEERVVYDGLRFAVAAILGSAQKFHSFTLKMDSQRVEAVDS